MFFSCFVFVFRKLNTRILKSKLFEIENRVTLLIYYIQKIFPREDSSVKNSQLYKTV